MSTSGTGITLRVLLGAQLRQQPARLLLMIAVIAIGVALGTAVYLVNVAALKEFTQASKRLIGESDLIVRGPASGFDEHLYPTLAQDAAIRIASPMLEVQAAISGRPTTLKILGLDIFRAGALQPALIAGLNGDVRRLFAPDGIYLSSSAATDLNLHAGDSFTIVVQGAPTRVTVLGLLPLNTYTQPLGIMDIASAQWRFGALGRLTRIDLQLQPGVDVDAYRASLDPRLPPGVVAIAPTVERDRAVTVTRAYRVNLNMLALVSLLTSAFLVFSVQSLSMVRRRASIALLRALGVTGSQIQRALLAEGALIGAVGSALGVLGGILAAAAAVKLLNGDLGNGQIQMAGHTLTLPVLSLSIAFLTGVAFCCAGAWLPAREASHRPPALALKAGDFQWRVEHQSLVLPGTLLLLVGAALIAVPPRHGIPIAGYFSIAAILFGAIFWVPAFTRSLLRVVPRTQRIVLDAALAQMNGSHGTLFLSLAPIIVSFALMVSMAIMVYSFRQSFDLWLIKLLPADIELRLPPGNTTTGLSAADQTALRTLPGVAQADFRRTLMIYLAADREPVTVIARDVGARRLGDVLPLVKGDPGLVDENGAWVSEAAADKFGYVVGQSILLPVGGVRHSFRIDGLWRDYARPNGAIVISRSRYLALSGDATATEGSLRLLPGAVATQVESAVRAHYINRDALDITTSADIRQRSLRLFDRAFAITYALEGLAVLIGLAGISVAAGFTAITRRAEFGMLRHLGVLKSQVIQMLAVEGIVTALLGAVFGLALGILLSLILVFIINRQSFNWSIDFSLPLVELASLAAALIVAAAITAVLSGRSALGEDAVRAVREDW